MFINLQRKYDYLLVEANVHECMCEYYCKYHNEMCYKAPVRSMFVMFSIVGHCRYCNELYYKAP